jgi:hypothetical protein
VKRWSRPLLAFGLSVGVTFAASFPVAAWAGHNWTGQHWHTTFINIYAGPSTGGCFKDRLFDATERSSAFSWNFHTQTPFNYRGVADGDHDAKAVSWGATNFNSLGETYRQVDGHVITYNHTHIDPDFNWFCGTGDAPDNKVDLWSVLTHEAGHWIRLGDLPDSANVCDDNSNQSTMCRYFLGTERQRTPNVPEDINSANDAY